jgi:uncharacterized protein YbjT (DUF2867 family)
MRVVVIGASGFVGSLLVPRLCERGYRVRAVGRDERRVRDALARACGARTRDAMRDVQVVSADALTARALAQALDGAEVAYYLIHSMERVASHEASFPERERVAAESFAAAAKHAGVRRIVYLGGVTPRTGGGGARTHAGEHEDALGEALVSRHLASRARVERILLAAVPDSLALRASIVIGARSRSFRLLVHLLERMRVLALPAWQSLRTQPIDERDVTDMLVACATARLERRSLDVGGPETLSYGEMLRRIAELMLVSRPALRLGVNVTGVTARVAAAIAGEQPELVLALMEGLAADLLPADDHAAQLLGVRLHSFDSAVEHALAEWERRERLAAR